MGGLTAGAKHKTCSTQVRDGALFTLAIPQPGARLATASGVTGGTEGTGVTSAADGCVTTGAATARGLRGLSQDA